MPGNKQYRSSARLPVAGICLYIVLYVIATFMYPGGSDIDRASKGFSWLHNYWCELMASHAVNGMPNDARPVAIGAFFVLAASLFLFWYRAPVLFNNSKTSYWLIRYTGIFSMVALLLFFVLPHDWAMNIAGIPGVVALFAVMAGLYKQRLPGLLWLGIVCVVLCALNNYIYYSTASMYYLPKIQKITFFLFLLWFSLVSVTMRGNFTQRTQE
jgi:hypothetical protein